MTARAACIVGVAVLGLVLLVPSVAALLELRGRAYSVDDLHTVRMWVNITMTASDAAVARQEADTDADGAVTEAERGAYETRLRDDANAKASSPQATLDRAVPTLQDLQSVTSRGLAGVAARTEDVEYDYAWHLAWPGDSDLAEHTFHRDTTRQDAGPVKVTVPMHFVAQRGTGINGFTVSQDKRTVNGTSDGQMWLNVVFVPDPSRSGAVPATSGRFDEPASPATSPPHKTPSVAGPFFVLTTLAMVLLARMDRRPSS